MVCVQHLTLQKRNVFSRTMSNRFNNYRLRTQFTALPAGGSHYIAA
ncbi:hypothetical protein GF367_01345 [Candidatus Woesearchaeota archaeon]|nr:hypothetical protein [Candidatus Woesearchaeota archaeon]